MRPGGIVERLVRHIVPKNTETTHIDPIRGSLSAQSTTVSPSLRAFFQIQKHQFRDLEII
jgi:hypothetical protein